MLNGKGIPFLSYKDHVIFDKYSLMTGNDRPYTVFTPYSKKWKDTLQEHDFTAYQSESIRDKWVVQHGGKVPAAKKLGFKTFKHLFQLPLLDSSVVREYHQNRNFRLLVELP